MRTSLVLACVLLAACGGGGGGGGGNYNGGDPVGPNNPPPAGTTVNANANLTFTPATVTVAVGDSVTWVFGSVAHTVSFQQGAVNTGEYGGEVSSGTPPADITATANASVGRRFAVAGIYHYRCDIHPAMLGTVQVQ